ncbi:baseplate hub protein [Singulisphaera rosea]
MSSAFDARVIEVDLVLPDQTYTFSGDYAIYAGGTKFGSASMNTCECRIDNLTKELRNTILTLASPLLSPPANNPTPTTRVPVVLNLKAGRESTGTFLLFTGNVISCEVTQPPDIGIVLRSLTNNYNMSLILGLQQPATTRLSEIAQVVATQNGLFLDFEATDKQIDNYSFTGSLQNNIEKLNQMGGIQAGVDNGTLWVIDADSARKNTGFLINEASGMVGIPQVTDQGVTVKVMLNNAILIGGSVTIQSTTNPAANGTFKVAKMDYEIASREQPFWYTLLCSNLGIFQGST